MKDFDLGTITHDGLTYAVTLEAWGGNSGFRVSLQPADVAKYARTVVAGLYWRPEFKGDADVLVSDQEQSEEFRGELRSIYRDPWACTDVWAVVTPDLVAELEAVLRASGYVEEAHRLYAESFDTTPKPRTQAELDASPDTSIETLIHRANPLEAKRAQIEYDAWLHDHDNMD